MDRVPTHLGAVLHFQRQPQGEVTALQLWRLLFYEPVGPDLGVFHEVQKSGLIWGSVGFALVGRIGAQCSRWGLQAGR